MTLNLKESNNQSWKALPSTLSGERLHSDDTPKHIHDFVNYHRAISESSDLLSLPLPEVFFNESCYPEFELTQDWIFVCSGCFNAYLYMLRECGGMIMKHIVNNPKDPALFKYFTDCQNARKEILLSQSRYQGDAETKQSIGVLRKKYIG